MILSVPTPLLSGLARTFAFCAMLVVSTIGWAWVSDDAPKKPEQEPRVVSPAENQAPPSDAIVLFDGTSLEGWKNKNGSESKWILEDGAMRVNGGSVLTEREFGDIQLHLEFATPSTIKGEGQGRGNSGVYLQARYEIQILDSYENKTYPNGQCGAVYGQSPPMVNACRPPGEWQTYDIVFRAARFDDQGQKIEPPRITVMHNGVLIQDAFDIRGPTTAAMFKDDAAKGPLYLQDHGNGVRYRNIWVRELE